MAGTPVQMADGSTKPVEQVAQGDWDLSRNAITGQTEAKPVQWTSILGARALVTLSFADESGSRADQLTTTPNHPFYVAGEGFVHAGDLVTGDEVVTRLGTPVIVTEITRQNLSKAVPVYNFNVADDHTYFVGSTNGGEWVHNTNCFRSPKLAVQHFLKHVKGVIVNNGEIRGTKVPDVPELATFRQYNGAAAQLGAANRPRGVMQFTGRSGDLFRFDPKTGYFGIRAHDGVVRTLFRPDDGIDYFLSQMAKETGSGGTFHL